MRHQGIVVGLTPGGWGGLGFRGGKQQSFWGFQSLVNYPGRSRVIRLLYYLANSDQHNLRRSHQHGFRQDHSCESQLILSMEDIYRQQDKNKQVDMLILDFTKAFDTVPHQRLLMKLKHYGIDIATSTDGYHPGSQNALSK